MVNWVDDRTLEASGTSWLTLGDDQGALDRALAMASAESTVDRFMLQKPRTTVDRYLQVLRELEPRTIVELGVFKGGSTSLIAEVARPDKLVAFELAPHPIEALEEWIVEQGMSDQVRVHYGIDQAEVDRVLGVVRDEVGAAPLDLVLDDASHALGRSRRSFNSLFPLLRRGGVYVIEDWGLVQRLGIYTADKAPLTILMFELAAMVAVTDDLVADVRYAGDAVFIRRGEAELPEPFDIGEALSLLRLSLLPNGI